MVYITGDCHGDWRKFSTSKFKDQTGMTRDDYVIVCGDFGLWHDDKSERYWLDWLTSKPFTVCFVDGNHENFDRLYGDEFDVVDFNGGKAHRIRDNVYHLIRGHVFTLCGKKFFAFGGARSHDISDGIIDRDDYENETEFKVMVARYRIENKMFRINHMSWWEEEMPSNDEMAFGLKTLSDYNNEVDYVVSHCCPQHVISLISDGLYKPDKLTSYFNEVSEKLNFTKWFFGHYHCDMSPLPEYVMLYDKIVRVV